MTYKTYGAMAFLTAALIFGACAKKKDAREVHGDAPGATTAIVIPPDTEKNKKIEPNLSSPKTVLEGLWWTDCTEKTDHTVYARSFLAENNVLTYVEYTYANLQDCRNDDVDGSNGTAGAQYFRAFRITPIGDILMTHKVEYFNPDGSLHAYNWVLRMEPNNRQFRSVETSFLTSRNSAATYNDIYYKYDY